MATMSKRAKNAMKRRADEDAQKKRQIARLGYTPESKKKPQAKQRK